MGAFDKGIENLKTEPREQAFIGGGVGEAIAIGVGAAVVAGLVGLSEWLDMKDDENGKL